MNNLEKFRDIRTFIFDVDGVMTGNKILLLEDGSLLREMNVRDGLALKLAVQSGYGICIITGGQSEGVRLRLQGLGIKDIFLGKHAKLQTFEEYVHSNDLNPEEILYMGDDIPDFPVMRRVGLAACPKDAVKEVFQIANYISPYNGGQGCVRDVIEKVMRLQNKWPSLLDQ